MSLRNRLLLAMLFAIVALAGPGRVNTAKAEYGAQKPNASSRAPVPASLLPIQFKDPKDLAIGKLLVASRSLGDPHFAGTVILLVHYSESGVVGLILNRRTEVPLSQVLDLKAAKDRPDPVYFGGPVEPLAVFALFQSWAKIDKAVNVFPGVYMISDKDVFEKTLSTQPDSHLLHVYLGYAGWTQDQLQTEVKMGAWFVFPADAATVFNSDPDSLWLHMIRKTELQMAKAETPTPPAYRSAAPRHRRLRQFSVNR